MLLQGADDGSQEKEKGHRTSDDDAILTSLAQFDLLANLAAIDGAGSTDSGVFYTNWSYVDHLLLPPGSSEGRHRHTGVEEIYFVLSGSGSMELDGERAPVEPGDAVAIAPGAWHQITATGSEPLRFLCCCAPPYRHEDTFFE